MAVHGSSHPWLLPPLQSCVPPSDVRMGLAMETHGVEAVRLTPPIPGGLLSKLQTPQIPSQYLVAFFTALPVLALVVTYLATQLQAHLKVSRLPRSPLSHWPALHQVPARQQLSPHPQHVMLRCMTLPHVDFHSCSMQ